MLVVLSDTHGDDDPRLSDHLRETVQRADTVVHAGDFTTAAVLDAFEELADRLVAVSGNRDGVAVRNRLPTTATVEAFDRRILVVHGHEHDRTSLSLLARQEDADVVIVGHTHRPAIEQLGDVTVLNPGSYADPRGARRAYATLETADGAVVGKLRTPEGEAFDTGGLSEGRSGSAQF